MDVINDLSHFDKKKYPPLVVALGNFDGVHLGHQLIIDSIKKRALEINSKSAVFTFHQHPRRVLAKGEAPKILTSTFHKLFLLDKFKVDVCFLIEFTKDFSEIKAEPFVKEILLETIGTKDICLGFNARFGHNRSGDVSLMKKLSKKMDFNFIETQPFKANHHVVSSSLIRDLVIHGHLDEASHLLGRQYSFFGTVVKGKGRGAGLGFPTANLDPHSEVMPPEGVYPVLIRLVEAEVLENPDGSRYFKDSDSRLIYHAIMNYGKRPTFGEDSVAVPEVHVLNFHENLLNKTVEVILGQKLRGEVKFPNEQALCIQIKADIIKAKEWFKTYEEKLSKL